MFSVYLDDGKLDISKLDNICYIINKAGIFLRKKVGLIDSLIKVDNISHLNSSVSQFGKIEIPKIDKLNFSKIVKFFYWAYKEHRGEGVVLIYYNPDTKDYNIFPTDQQVSAASASYVKEGLSHTGYLLVGTIHSHANFSASHSGIDDDDELNFDGLHITVGNVNDTYQTISCSIVINGKRFLYQPQEYIDGIVPITITNKNNDKVVNKDNRFLVFGLTDAKFDDDWKSKVQKRIYQQYKHTWTYASIGQSWNNVPIGRSFNKDYYPGLTNNKIHTSNKNFSSMNMFDLQDEPEFDPCSECIYRDFKSEKLIEELIYDNVNDDEDFDDFYYFNENGELDFKSPNKEDEKSTK